MSELELPGDVRVALSHAAAYGLAAIVEDSGIDGVRVGWTQSLDARAVVVAPDIGHVEIAAAVHEHARRHAGPDSWTAATMQVGGVTAARLSPRIKAPADDREWVHVARQRHETIDREIARRRWLDLALIGALGEPAYWRVDAQGRRLPDEGASRWEMKTRNRGEDFVQHRLRRLAVSVAARQATAVLDGLAGVTVVDEAGKNDPASRTATGLAPLGPVDNAVAWCALWGLSLFPVVPRTGQASETAGHGTARRPGSPRLNWFHLPIPLRPLTLARMATILASEQLAAAAAATAAPERARAIGALAAREWLLERDIGGIARFPIGTFGSANAPERRALLGSVVRLVP